MKSVAQKMHNETYGKADRLIVFNDLATIIIKLNAAKCH